MEKKKSYKWVKRLINKITKDDAPLNNHFEYYGYTIMQGSGTRDFTDVTILDKKNHSIAEFDYDFLTEELIFSSYCDDEIRMAILKGFLECYNAIRVSDETLKERREEYEEYVFNPDEYIEEAVEKAKKELAIIDKLPIGYVRKRDLI